MFNLGSQQGYAAPMVPGAQTEWPGASQPPTVVPQGVPGVAAGAAYGVPGAAAAASTYGVSRVQGYSGYPGYPVQQGYSSTGGYVFKNQGYGTSPSSLVNGKNNFQYPQYVRNYAPMHGSKFGNFPNDPRCEFFRQHKKLKCGLSSKIELINRKFYCKEHAKTVAGKWAQAEQVGKPPDMNIYEEPPTTVRENPGSQMYHGTAPPPTMASLGALQGAYNASNLANQGASALLGAASPQGGVPGVPGVSHWMSSAKDIPEQSPHVH